MKFNRPSMFDKLAAIFWSILAVAILAVALCGCSSAVQSISAEASDIDDLSRSSEGRFVTIGELSDDDKIHNETKHGISEQQAIQSSVATIREELPRVEDRRPWWSKMVGRVAIAGALIAILLILWNTGIGHLLRRLVYSVSYFIPSASRRAAEMDSKIASDDHDMTIDEAIAARRASDPAYDAAYENLKRRKPQ